MEAFRRKGLRSDREAVHGELPNNTKKKKATSPSKPPEEQRSGERQLVDLTNDTNCLEDMIVQVKKSFVALVLLWAALCAASGVAWKLSFWVVAGAISSVFVIRLGSMLCSFKIPGIVAPLSYAAVCVDPRAVKLVFCTQVAFAVCRYASVVLVFVMSAAYPKSGGDVYSFLVPFLLSLAAVIYSNHQAYDCDYFQAGCTFEDVYGYTASSSVAIAVRAWWHGIPFALYELFSVFLFVYVASKCLCVVGAVDFPGYGLNSFRDFSAFLDTCVDSVLTAAGKCLCDKANLGFVSNVLVVFFLGRRRHQAAEDGEEEEHGRKAAAKQNDQKQAAAPQAPSPPKETWVGADDLFK